MTPTQSIPAAHHPVVVAQKIDRRSDIQLRVADAITKFAGSMMFVYIHIGLFAIWMVFAEGDVVLSSTAYAHSPPPRRTSAPCSSRASWPSAGARRRKRRG